MTLDLERRKALKLAGGALASAAIAAPASAQATLPAGTLKILVGYPPGGGTDVMARIIADKLKERLGQNVLIENRPGASGTLAGALLRDGPADGSVVMYVASAGSAAQKVSKKHMLYDLEKDITPVVQAGTLCTVYAVSSSIGVRTFAEYVEWLKKNRSKANFGTTAMGSSTHFFGVEIGQANIVAGRVPAGCGGLTSFLRHQPSGRVRILGVSSARRLSAAPEVPAIAELGYPKLLAEGFYAFYAPAKTPHR